MSVVSTSVYQKLVEENRILLADIRLLTEKHPFDSPDRYLCIMKWRKLFKEEQEKIDALKAIFRMKVSDQAGFR